MLLTAVEKRNTIVRLGITVVIMYYGRLVYCTQRGAQSFNQRETVFKLEWKKKHYNNNNNNLRPVNVSIQTGVTQYSLIYHSSVRV